MTRDSLHALEGRWLQQSCGLPVPSSPRSPPGCANLCVDLPGWTSRPGLISTPILHASLRALLPSFMVTEGLLCQTLYDGNTVLNEANAVAARNKFIPSVLCVKIMPID